MCQADALLYGVFARRTGFLHRQILPNFWGLWLLFADWQTGITRSCQKFWCCDKLLAPPGLAKLLVDWRPFGAFANFLRTDDLLVHWKIPSSFWCWLDFGRTQLRFAFVTLRMGMGMKNLGLSQSFANNYEPLGTTRWLVRLHQNLPRILEEDYRPNEIVLIRIVTILHPALKVISGG